MDKKDTTINSNSIGDATDIWATVLMFRESKKHVPPVDMDWEDLESKIGMTNPYKRQILFKVRERFNRIATETPRATI